MKKDVATVTGRMAVGGGSILVRDLDTPDPLTEEASLPVLYRRGSRTPRKGERLATWRDVTTLYAIAPQWGEEALPAEA